MTKEELRPSDAELREWCEEILHWQSTGVLHGSALRKLADEKFQHIPERYRLRLAENLVAEQCMRRIVSAQPGVDVPKAGDKALDIMRRYRAGIFDPVLEKRSSIGILVEEIERLTDPIAWQLAKAPPAPVSDAVVGALQQLHKHFADTRHLILDGTEGNRAELGDEQEGELEEAEKYIGVITAVLQAAMSTRGK